MGLAQSEHKILPSSILLHAQALTQALVGKHDIGTSETKGAHRRRRVGISRITARNCGGVTLATEVPIHVELLRNGMSAAGILI